MLHFGGRRVLQAGAAVAATSATAAVATGQGAAVVGTVGTVAGGIASAPLLPAIVVGAVVVGGCALLWKGLKG